MNLLSTHLHHRVRQIFLDVFLLYDCEFAFQIGVGRLLLHGLPSLHLLLLRYELVSFNFERDVVYARSLEVLFRTKLCPFSYRHEISLLDILLPKKTRAPKHMLLNRLLNANVCELGCKRR